MNSIWHALDSSTQVCGPTGQQRSIRAYSTCLHLWTHLSDSFMCMWWMVTLTHTVGNSGEATPRANYIKRVMLMLVMMKVIMVTLPKGSEKPQSEIPISWLLLPSHHLEISLGNQRWSGLQTLLETTSLSQLISHIGKLRPRVVTWFAHKWLQGVLWLVTVYSLVDNTLLFRSLLKLWAILCRLPHWHCPALSVLSLLWKDCLRSGGSLGDLCLGMGSGVLKPLPL